MQQRQNQVSAGERFRAAVREEQPLQVAGAINAYTARMAEATGFRALYVSGGGVAANSLGIPDLGISTMEDVLIDVRRITDASSLPLLVDIDTGWGGAFNIARDYKVVDQGRRWGRAHGRPGGAEALRTSAGQGTCACG
jgi:methylisocitrate lyase